MKKEEGKRKEKGTNEEQQNIKSKAHKIKSKKCIITPPLPSMFTNSLPVSQCRSHFHAQSKEMKKKDSTMKQIQNMGMTGTT